MSSAKDARVDIPPGLAVPVSGMTGGASGVGDAVGCSPGADVGGGAVVVVGVTLGPGGWVRVGGGGGWVGVPLSWAMAADGIPIESTINATPNTVPIKSQVCGL